MFTSIKTFDSVVGGWLFLTVCLLSLAAGIFISRKNWRSLLAVFLSGLLGDAAWYLLYFPNGEYRNMGLAAISGLVVYPICVAIGLVITDVIGKIPAEESE